MFNNIKYLKNNRCRKFQSLTDIDKGSSVLKEYFRHMLKHSFNTLQAEWYYFLAVHIYSLNLSLTNKWPCKKHYGTRTSHRNLYLYQLRWLYIYSFSIQQYNYLLCNYLLWLLMHSLYLSISSIESSTDIWLVFRHKS